MDMSLAYISGLAAMAGSAVGALASSATTWLTQRHQSDAQRRSVDASRRARLFGEFINQASETYADAIACERLQNPAKLVPIYAAISKLRMIATAGTIEAAEIVLQEILEAYDQPPLVPRGHDRNGRSSDILRFFAECCRAELRNLH
ncbi:hypothetical protein MesoLj131c_17000 [Mesorhizobium sp. 131-3-5]|nr:hypothetical protein MesoLj131c_17000 [Mesorhizobium sp. 131-3-5]